MVVEVIINGQSINGQSIVTGRRIVVGSGRVWIDGVDTTPQEAKDIRIEVHGDVQTLEVDACAAIKITGAVGNVKTQSGDVQCGDVTGSIRTGSGDVECGSVGGHVSTGSGDVVAGDVGGDVSTGSGDIRR